MRIRVTHRKNTANEKEEEKRLYMTYTNETDVRITSGIEQEIQRVLLDKIRWTARKHGLAASTIQKKISLWNV